MPRIYERQTDALFATALDRNRAFVRLFLTVIDGVPENGVVRIAVQTPHQRPGDPGSIDLELTRADGSVLLVENRIDVADSVTRRVDPQPARYRASVAALRGRGLRAASVLLAPRAYLTGSRHAFMFDHLVSYEVLRPALAGAELALLEAAIVQAATPHDPVPNASSAAFLADYHAFARAYFAELVIKRTPDGSGLRPTALRMIHFDAPRTLRRWPALPRPRMSLQCRDSADLSASVRIVLGGWGARAGSIPVPARLSAIGGYIRPRGSALGLMIDIPGLETRMPFDAQVRAVEEGLDAARRLAQWWNHHAETLIS